MEIWVDIPNYEGLYEVSNYGNVRKSDGTLMNGSLNSYGYRVVSLTKSGKKKDKKVHRLVASAFLPTIPGKDVVNHIDGDKLNNYAGNLEWCTKGENVRHATMTLDSRRAPRPVLQLSGDGEPIAIFVSAAAAARSVGCTGALISACCNGTATTAQGYRWEEFESETLATILKEHERRQLLHKIAEMESKLNKLKEML